MTTEQSKVFAKLQGRVKASYKHVQEAEAKAAGRALPGGLEGAIGQVTQVKVDEDKNGDPYLFIYTTVLEPAEYFGVCQGYMHRFTEDRFNTEQENQRRLSSDIKLLGYEKLVERNENIVELAKDVCETLTKEKPTFTFNTSRRQRKDGTYTAFIQGPTEAGYEPPKPEGRNDHEDNGYKKVEDKKETKEPAKAPSKAPSKKGPTKKKVAFEVDDRVITTGDYFEQGEEYEGTILSVDGDSAMVKFEDDSEQEIPLANLQPLK